MKFYLAGPFRPIEKDRKYADWRDYVTAKVRNHTFIDPRDNNQSCPATFTSQDLESVIKSDGVILYRPKSFGEIIGGAWEHGIACGATRLGKKIPTIYIDEKPFTFPVLAASAKRAFTDLDAAIVYLNFLKTWKNEFKAIYSYLEWENSAFK